MKTQRSDHGMDLDGMFSGRNAGEHDYRGVARSGNMGNKAPVSDYPVVSGLGGGMGDVAVTVDTSTIVMGIGAVGLGLLLWYKFGR